MSRSRKDLRPLLARYLAAAEDARPALAEEIARQPAAAFDGIMTFRGPYPDGLHVMDAHEGLLFPLLTRILKAHPELLNGRDLSKLEPGKRFVVIACAIDTEDPRLADVILAALRDRSVAVKVLAADGVRRHAFLRRPDARRQLEKLVAQPSIASSDHDRPRVQRALETFG